MTEGEYQEQQGLLDGWAEGDVDESEELPCRYCKTPVYWGPHYGEKGDFDRRLYTAATRRLHDCRVKPDINGFDVVPE